MNLKKSGDAQVKAACCSEGGGNWLWSVTEGGLRFQETRRQTKSEAKSSSSEVFA